MRQSKLWIVLLLFAATVAMAHADVGLLLEQPFGKLGDLSPTGHSAIYLSRVCAESPTKLRRCGPGETGVVISRYSGVDGYDWIAVPLMPYLYAVDRPQQIPSSVDAKTIARLQNRYRQKHLESLIPDAPNGKMPGGEWIQLLGNSYIRKIYVFEIQTSAVQDDLLIAELNSRPNKKHFNYFFRNCANFAESVLNFYYPHAVHRSFTADFGLVTPKQVAKSFVSYAQRHSDLQFSVFVIPQVPGTVHRSHQICGVVEALVKKKQFAIPLIIWQPYVVVALAGIYLTRGRFNPERHSILLNRENEVQALLRDAMPLPNEKVQPGRIEKASVNSNPRTRDGDCSSSPGCSRQTATE